jgi:putative glutamine amidotransferase
MRLVSALYRGTYPFDSLSCVTEETATDDPNTLAAGDILIVWGGEDIHPSLYGRSLSRQTGAPKEGPARRCRLEWALMQRAKELGIPIIGVCRGAQMLCALAGGILFQHVEGHGGRHTVHTWDDKEIVVNSIHHQMMCPKGTNHELLAWLPTHLSNVYWDEDRVLSREDVEVEPEFIYFTDVKGYAIQWHPEMMNENSDANKYVLSYLENSLGTIVHGS